MVGICVLSRHNFDSLLLSQFSETLNYKKIVTDRPPSVRMFSVRLTIPIYVQYILTMGIMKRMKEYVMKGVNSGFCSSVCSSDFEHSVENHSKNV